MLSGTALTERNEAHETIETLTVWANSVDQELTKSQQELRHPSRLSVTSSARN